MEGLGAVSSVVQVVQTGIQLATTLYAFASDVKDAEKDIKGIAHDVRLTARVLERTHNQVTADPELCTHNAMADFEDVVNGCRNAFQKIYDSLPVLKGSKDGAIPVSDRLKWGLNLKKKLEALRANLEELKSTLLVMLNVLLLSKLLENRMTVTDRIKVDIEKLQINTLVRAKDEAVQRHEELKASMAKLESCIPSFEQFQTTQPDCTKKLLEEDDHPLSEQFGDCIRGVGRLSESVESAAKRWTKNRVFRIYNIEDDFRLAGREFQRLRAMYSPFSESGPILPAEASLRAARSCMPQATGSSRNGTDSAETLSLSDIQEHSDEGVGQKYEANESSIQDARRRHLGEHELLRKQADLAAGRSAESESWITSGAAEQDSGSPDHTDSKFAPFCRIRWNMLPRRPSGHRRHPTARCQGPSGAFYPKTAPPDPYFSAKGSPVPEMAEHEVIPMRRDRVRMYSKHSLSTPKWVPILEPPDLSPAPQVLTQDLPVLDCSNEEEEEETLFAALDSLLKRWTTVCV